MKKLTLLLLLLLGLTPASFSTAQESSSSKSTSMTITPPTNDLIPADSKPNLALIWASFALKTIAGLVSIGLFISAGIAATSGHWKGFIGSAVGGMVSGGALYYATMMA